MELRKDPSAIQYKSIQANIISLLNRIRGGPERTGPRPPPWVPLLKNLLMVAVFFPPV